MQHVVPRLEKAGVCLLAQLLAYDPARRISARRALQHPYFADLRTAEAAADALVRKFASSCRLDDTAVLGTTAPAATPHNQVLPLQSQTLH